MRYAPIIVAVIAIAGICAAVAVSQTMSDDDPGEQVIEVTVPYNIANAHYFQTSPGQGHWSAHIIFSIVEVPLGTLYHPGCLSSSDVVTVTDAQYPIFMWSVVADSESGLYEVPFSFEREGYAFHPVLVDWDVTQSA